MSGGPVVQCIPNFSEGRRTDVIQAIADAVRETAGCSLLDVDSGVTNNRTVYTYVGAPTAVVQAALAAARVAFQRIDMSKHKGQHPRMGALDAIPFIPVSNVTMEKCAECAREFSQRLAEELHVPVYLVDRTREYRQSLAQIRVGEYEGLKEKLKQPQWSPDFGPAEFVPRWGATVVAARTFLIAYNVNLLSTKEQAHRIALNLREQGRGAKEPGRLKAVKALGWYLDEKDMAQVSMNLNDYEVTPLHTAFEECKKEAKSLNLAVMGSEVVGLVPLKVMLMAAEYYMEQENLFILHEHQKIMLAIQRLGLNFLEEFNPQKKIVEYRIGSNKDGPLLSGSVRQFVESLAARSPCPNGSTAAVSIASIGAALGTMVGLLTFGSRKFESLDPLMRQTIVPLHEAMQQLLLLTDQDVQAFSDYDHVQKLPHRTEEEKTSHHRALDCRLKKVVEVPLSLMRVAHSCWPHLVTLASHGNFTALSHLQVGTCSLDAGIHGAYYSISTNLKDLTDSDYVAIVTAEVEEMVREAEKQSSRVQQLIKGRSS